MKKYYIIIVRSIRKIVTYDELTDTEVYTYVSDISYKQCSREQAMQRLERDRELINRIDRLRAK